MRTKAIGLAAILGLSFLSFAVRAQDTADSGKLIERGRYLAEEVARCQDCHTPHLMGSGELVKSAWMKGTQLDFVKIEPPPGWHSRTPDITSTSILWTNWGEDGMVRFLETAKNPRGNHAGAPMPPYMLQHDDAVAIAAYLKSLK